MIDRELLELAAKAAGYVIESFSSSGGAWVHPAGEQPDEDGDHPGLFLWNPLANDGDALRLMATLNIDVHFRENINGAFVVAERHDIEFCPESLDGPHEWDATRRAIVRAAAEIGRSMP